MHRIHHCSSPPHKASTRVCRLATKIQAGIHLEPKKHIGYCVRILVNQHTCTDIYIKELMVLNFRWFWVPHHPSQMKYGFTYSTRITKPCILSLTMVKKIHKNTTIYENWHNKMLWFHRTKYENQGGWSIKNLPMHCDMFCAPCDFVVWPNGQDKQLICPGVGW